MAVSSAFNAWPKCLKTFSFPRMAGIVAKVRTGVDLFATHHSVHGTMPPEKFERSGMLSALFPPTTGKYVGLPINFNVVRGLRGKGGFSNVHRNVHACPHFRWEFSP